jgi:hypothetical protein
MDQSQTASDNFVDFSDAVRWPFFSWRDIPPEESNPNATETYSLEARDVLWADTRSPEKKASDDAEWEAVEKSRKMESWAKQVMAGGMRVKRFLEWIVRCRERYKAHAQDHLRWFPFKWLTMRDCPVCRFGEREWRHWEAIVLMLDLPTWVEFWDWIEDARRQCKDMLERDEDEYSCVENSEMVRIPETAEAYAARMEDVEI